MKKYSLSFADINMISENIAEVVIHANTVVTLEMTEELDIFIDETFVHAFAILINKVNPYQYTYESRLSIASWIHLKAIAVVNYSEKDKETIEKLFAKRKRDGWNLKIFPGLDLGWQDGIDWLYQQLNQQQK